MMIKIFLKKASGFTLVEIMIAVAIIGLLSIVAVPQFIRVKQSASVNICVSNLKLIDDAKSMWAVYEGAGETDTPEWEDLVPDYIRKIPVCPSGGSYTLGRVNTYPACSIQNHELFSEE
ncbi:MAG: prepilin-type N-terminal cleavage/methylation domain-containing protein [Candidatus Omnitrophota bacterium]